jgi:hypothetical protein
MRTINEIINTFKQALSEAGSALAGFQYGSNTWALMRSVASVIQAQELKAENLQSRFYLSQAQGIYLDLRAADFGLRRVGASKSKGYVLARSSYPINLPLGTLLTTKTGIQLSTITPITISSVEVPIPVESVTRGSQANLEAGTSVSNLAYPTLFAEVGRYRFTNGLAQEPLRGGIEEESDSSFRSRIQSQFGSNLTDLNYLLSSQLPDLGEFYLQEQNPGPGYVTIYISSREQEQVEALKRDLDSIRPVGLAYRIELITYRPIFFLFRVQSNQDLLRLQQTLSRNTANYLNTLTPGSTFSPPEFEQYIRSFTPDSAIYLARPSSPIELGPGEKFELQYNSVFIENLP